MIEGGDLARGLAIEGELKRGAAIGFRKVIGPMEEGTMTCSIGCTGRPLQGGIASNRWQLRSCM